MMNAQERKHLYEKYGRARSSLAKFAPKKEKSIIENILNGRRTVNSDTFIINDLTLIEPKNELNSYESESSDDDNDVTMILSSKKSSNSLSSGSSQASSNSFGQEENMLYMRRRSSGMLETLKNLICVGQK